MIGISSTTRHRLSPLTTVIGGAAFGLIAGATVYGAVSSSAQETAPAAFKAPLPAAARLANCTGGFTLENGVCVVHIAGTVGVPSPRDTAAVTAKATHLAADKTQPSKAGDKKSDKDGDDGSKRAGTKPERDGTGHEGLRGEDGDGRAPTSAVKTAAPVRAPAPAVTPSPTAASVRSAAS